MASPIDPIGAITLLVKLGMEIRERYKVYSRASNDLKKLDGHLSVSLFVLETFQKFIQSGVRSLRKYQQQQIARLVDQLQGVFDNANWHPGTHRLDKQMSRFPPDAKFDIVGKLRWSFGGKSGYEAVLQEMRDWQRDLHEVIAAIKLLQEQDMEEERSLYKQLFEVGGEAIRQVDVMDDMVHGRIDANTNSPGIDMTAPSFSEICSDGDRKIVRLENKEIVYVEYRYYEARSPEEILESVSDVRKLASVLWHVDASSMHILRCIGTNYQEEFSRSLLVYNIPSVSMRSTPDVKFTLAKVIEDSKALKPSLEVRVRYAVEICMAVMFTHAAGLVHKSICPDNVLTIDDFSTFLVGFDAARLRDLSAYSKQLPETDPIKKLYHHPERQIALQDGHVVRFGIRHDMYSLGVVLLELGMWKPLRRFNKELRNLISGSAQNFDAQKFQEKLIEEAKNNLAGETGSKYADAVVCCLEDTISQGTKEQEMREVFYERVLCQLRQIVV